ncbi:hypothetical protein [Streptomyces sp. RKAG293]|uniref:hypothetical protein n=1 Tax=Streptomyces sp. RKAG293 TaxID=2893403 RepID=UPI002034A1B8|nr:hypothetical protein [Streptomyces sp. RKAG293]MCM2420284.1 hypothetical protein [Streptomyces sp. RKAG293]
MPPAHPRRPRGSAGTALDPSATHPTGEAALTASTIPCPACGVPVIRTPAGELLDPTAHPLAVTRANGRRMQPADVIACALGRRPPVGHHPHRPGLLPPYDCRPPQAEQLALDLDLGDTPR